MSSTTTPIANTARLPDDTSVQRGIAARQQRGKLWRSFYLVSFVIAMVALALLLLNVVNQAFGVVAVQTLIDPAGLSDKPFEELSSQELADILVANQPNKLRVLIRDYLSVVDTALFTTLPLRQTLAGKNYPAELGDMTINEVAKLENGPQLLGQILSSNLSTDQLHDIVLRQVVGQKVLESWPLFDAIFNRHLIERIASESFPDAKLEFRSWLNGEFLTSTQSDVAADAGIRTALLGSFGMLLLTIAIAFPVGVGAAIYLEEYATDSPINRLIEINIRNLAGVPSIIYGMLGLAIFVRTLEPIFSGRVFGVEGVNGRTLLAASLTLALLILPVIITASQEAIRAVPRTVREASYGLGATKWQTVSRQVLPIAFPGILTGTIIAMSRAVGETAPLIIVGASTFILTDPTGPFSKFTALPIMIYNWTSKPDPQFRDAAAAAIIVLLALLLTMNATAIILRQRFSRRF